MHFPAVKQLKEQLHYAEHGRKGRVVGGRLPAQQTYGGVQQAQHFAPINYGAYGGAGKRKKSFLGKLFS